MNPKERIKQYLSEAIPEKAIDEWRGHLPMSHPLADKLILQNARLSEIKGQVQLGLITDNEAQTMRNKITLSLLEMLSEWHPNGDKEALYRLIDALPLQQQQKGPLFLYNCDRNSASKKFKRTFNGLRDSKKSFQFYFFPACSSQMPDSFAKRVIFQLLEDEYADDPVYHHLLHAPNEQVPVNFPYDENDAGRIKIEKLPLGSDVEASKRKFKAYVQRRFHFVDTQSFESFIETGVPKIEYDYVANVFELHEKEWEGDEGEIANYLQWMINTFHSTHPEVPVFLFFFVVRIKDFHDESQRTNRQRQILELLERLCQQNTAAVIREINPVDTDDLDEWLRNEAGISQPNDIRELTKALVKGLELQERQFFDAYQQFHMKDVEPLQRMIYEKIKPGSR